MAYIDPITGAYVADSLDALPPGYNQPKAGNEANVAQMRAQLNSEEALRQQQAAEQAKKSYLSDPTGLAKFAMERMPGASFVQGLMPSVLAPFQLAGSALYGAGNQAVNPQTANFDKDTAKAMQAMQYTPPTQAGRDISEGIAKVGEAVGPLPELWVPQRGRGFTPDDLRVAGRTLTEDVRNFPIDYANAKAGLQREYPTAGSRAAGFTDVAGDLSRPLAEKAYDMYMNPQSSVEVYGMRPGANLSGLVDVGSPMYAVKPKGGNWPTNLGSTENLNKQGALGKHLSQVQYDNPSMVFQNQLEKHFPRGIDNRKLVNDWEDYLHKRLGMAMDPNSPDRYLSNEELRRKSTDDFVSDFNSRLEEGQKPLHSFSAIEQALPHYNSWVMGPYQKYITNQMGTGLATDPLLQAVNESGMPPHEIFGQEIPRDWETESVTNRANRVRNDFSDTIFGYADSLEKQNSIIGKTTATTPEGLAYENALDASLYAKGPYSFTEKEGFPVSAKLDRNALISDFLTGPEERTGFDPIRKQVFQDLLSGKISPDKLSNVTPATVTRQMIKDKMAEFKEAQLSKKGAAEWIPKRAAQMPTDMAFPDGSKMTIITPEMAKADEAMTARDLGQITIDLNQCTGAGCHATQDYPGHGPYLVPHTGKPPRGKVEYDKYGYLRRLKDDRIEIASLKDPSGVSQATIELKLQGKSLDSANEILKRHREIKEWLAENAPDRLEQYIKDFSENGLTPSMMSKLWDIYGFDEFITSLAGTRKKSVDQIKGHSNNDIKEEYVPHVVEWLNKNADSLTDVRDLQHLPGVHDLTRSYDSVGKLVDRNQHWDADTVENFFDKVEADNLLPRFFTDKDFALLATDNGIDLSAPPKYTGNTPTLAQEAYEILSEELRKTYLENYLHDFERGDPDVRHSIITDLDSFPNQYGLDRFGAHTRQIAIERLLRQGLYSPANELNQMAGEMQAMQPEPIQNLRPARPTELQTTVLNDNMQNYFAGNYNHLMPEDMDEPYATQTRILMGSQNPEAQLPRDIHESLVESFLNQDDERHASNIRYIIDTLQGPGYFASMPELTTPQLENILNMAISWTERYPLAE